MKKKLTLISVILLILLAFTACNNDSTTREATDEDKQVAISYVLIAEDPNIMSVLDRTGNSEEGMTLTSNKDYTVNIAANPLAKEYKIESLVLKAGATVFTQRFNDVNVQDIEETKFPIVLNGKDYTFEASLKYNRDTKKYEGEIIINNKIVTGVIDLINQ